MGTVVEFTWNTHFTSAKRLLQVSQNIMVMIMIFIYQQGITLITTLHVDITTC